MAGKGRLSSGQTCLQHVGSYRCRQSVTSRRQNITSHQKYITSHRQALQVIDKSQFTTGLDAASPKGIRHCSSIQVDLTEEGKEMKMNDSRYGGSREEAKQKVYL